MSREPYYFQLFFIPYDSIESIFHFIFFSEALRIELYEIRANELNYPIHYSKIMKKNLEEEKKIN